MKRYVLQTDKYIVEEHYDVKSDSNAFFEPNFNVMPGTTMPIIIGDGDSRRVVSSQWGLELKDSDDNVASISQEEALERDEYKKRIKSSPCIIPASGFYKWKETVEDPLPFYIRVLSREVTSFAGFYSEWKNEKGRKIHSFSVLIMPANPLVQPLDATMPCILEEKDYDRWLNGESLTMIQEGFDGAPLLVDMAVVRVPELVNDPSNNSSELIQPIPKLRNYDGEDDED